MRRTVLLTAILLGVGQWTQAAPPAIKVAEVNRLLNQENKAAQPKAAGFVDDLAYLRRVTVDLVGRIPTEQEIQDHLKLPQAERRTKTVERLLSDPRFADRWTVFFADMLRIRTNADGGAALLAFVHKSIEDGLPYDDMAKQLISANGRAGRTPEIGYILGDNADPMALAGVTSQVFMGVRIACAQCHDHPFDTWKRKEFYGFAAYFGRTRRVESQLTKAVYTTEQNTNVVMWPPADPGFDGKREPIKPAFPFKMVSGDKATEYMVRLANLRAPKSEKGPNGPSVDDLLADAGSKVQKRTDGVISELADVASQAKRDAEKLNVKGDLYRASELRRELAELVTSPRNRYFSESFVNRVWAELVGRGFVEPIDDFSEKNAPSHPQTLTWLGSEFVASGYDLRALVRTIVTSEPYQRDRLLGVDEATRQTAENAFVSAPMRRMLSEALYDSIVQAGHLGAAKYPAGANPRVIKTLVRIPLQQEKKGDGQLASIKSGSKEGMPAMKPQMVALGGGYDLEQSIELNFAELLKQKDEVALDKMAVMSNEELEAMKMMPEGTRAMRYVERFVEQTIDDNPVFASAMRMVSPADPSHFLRIFGQPTRSDLGEHRDDSASMRQALMMLNGKLTHEAARVGDFEPIHPLVVGPKADLSKAIKLAYREILTREPNEEELSDAKSVIADAENPREGMADLRWVLLNCHEFRFLR